MEVVGANLQSLLTGFQHGQGESQLDHNHMVGICIIKANQLDQENEGQEDTLLGPSLLMR